jgi:YVTN family beta-propeller protein
VSYGLGVDLGTSFTGAAVSRGGHPQMITLGAGSALMPSVVQVQPDGTLLVGVASGPAEAPIGRDFKRRLGDPTPLVLGGQPHSAVSLLAATLKSVLETVTTAEGAAPDRVVLTYPAVWGPYRHEQFAEVPRRAGLETVTVMTEPEAAATHYATRQQLSDGDVVAVYDLGGGTFDTTVTRVTSSGMEILGVPEGVEWVGGVDFDEAVLAHVDQAVGGALSTLDPRDPISAGALQRIREECIRAKEALSVQESTVIPVLIRGRRTDVPLTRAEFEVMIRTPLESTLAALHRTLASAGVGPAELAGVLLVGGSSRIPLVSRMLSQELGRPVLVDPDPQHCVALGAAAIAERPVKRAPGKLVLPPGPRNRRRVIAVTAATAVTAALIGGAVWATRDPGSSKAPTATGPTPGLIGAPATSLAVTPKPTPSATPSAHKAVSPPLPFTSEVLGIAAKCMDTANAQSASGTVIQLFGCNGSPAQSWTFGKNHTVKIYGKCLDTGPASAVAKAAGSGPKTVQIRGCDGTADQRWQIDGTTIVNVGSKLCLDTAARKSADYTPLVTAACRDGASQVWTWPADPSAIADRPSLAVPKLASTVRGVGSQPQGIAISPDGTRAYVPSLAGKKLTVISTKTGAVLRSIPMPAAPQYVVAAPDGRRLYVTLADPALGTNSVQVVDALSGALLKKVKVGRTLSPPAVSPDGLLLYVPDYATSRLVPIDTTTYQLKPEISVADPAAVVFSPDGLQAFVADHETHEVSVLDVRAGTVTAKISVGTAPDGLAISPDGQQLAVANSGGRSVSLVNVAERGVGDTLIGVDPRGIAFAPDGRHVYIVNSSSDTVSVVSAQTGALTATVTVGDQPWAVAVTPNGKQAYVTNARSSSVSVLTTGR